MKLTFTAYTEDGSVFIRCDELDAPFLTDAFTLPGALEMAASLLREAVDVWGLPESVNPHRYESVGTGYGNSVSIMATFDASTDTATEVRVIR